MSACAMSACRSKTLTLPTLLAARRKVGNHAGNGVAEISELILAQKTGSGTVGPVLQRGEVELVGSLPFRIW